MKVVKNLLIASLLLTSGLSQANGDEELVGLMSSLQSFAHKVGLSLDAKNKQLVGFYVHELEEVIEEVEEVESYDGYKIGKLTEKLLVPALERFEDAYKAGDWVTANTRFDALIDTCNQCHNTTEHGYIKIQRSGVNPFMQDFSVQ